MIVKYGRLSVTVRKRTWLNPDGSMGAAWVVDYRDQHRQRHVKSFKRRKDADAHQATVALEVRQGTHAADHHSVTWSQRRRGCG